jgi:DNA-binding beta-propeller fold protein YncE
VNDVHIVLAEFPPGVLSMKRSHVMFALMIAGLSSLLQAQEPSTDGPYKVLQRAKVGGEGGSDYITADPVGRRLYIPRGGSNAVAATDSSPARAAVPGRITIFDLETLAPLGEIPGTGGQGVAIDPKSGHGFSSSRPQISMFDTKTMSVIKKIDFPAGFGPDGIYFDSFNSRVYVFSHPTRSALVIDSHDGNVVGTVDLGGTPEQAVGDGKGTLYVVMQDSAASVTVVDVKTMMATAHYPLGEIGSCNGLALDVKNKILFAACARSGTPRAAEPRMVVLSATDGKILATLPLAGSSDGAVFNPATMEAFSTHSNGTMTVVKEKSRTSFEVEENLQTMNGARTLSLDAKTGRIFAMSVERGPAPVRPAGVPPGGRGPQAPAIPGSFTILMIGK